MSLPTLNAQSQFFSTAALTDQVFAATDRYRLFAQKIYPLLLEVRDEVAKAYCVDNGRPAVNMKNRVNFKQLTIGNDPDA